MNNNEKDLSAYHLIILTPVFNRKKITLEYVQLLKKQTFHNFLLILIDNGNDSTGEEAQEVLENMIVLKGHQNLWWANSLQFAIDYLKKCKLKSDLIIHINNDDTSFDVNFLQSGIELVAMKSNALVCAKAVSNINSSVCDTGVFINWKNFTFNSWKIGQELNCTSTRGLFLKFSDLLLIGEFRPKILPHYLSDYEFTARAYDKGYELCVDDRLQLVFFEKETGEREVKKLGITQLLPHMFSLRNAMNPYIMLKFIWLRSPGIYKITNSIQVIYKMSKYVVRSILISLNLLSK